MDDDDERETLALRSVRWSPVSIPLAMCTAASGIFDALADAFGDLGLSFASHLKYHAEKVEFERDAGMSIERIVGDS